MKNKIISKEPIGLRLPVKSPYIITAHHYDLYPKGNDKMEPTYYIDGRDIGQDFDESEPWRMYHGKTIPGFPVHPHRGFETITIVEEGFVDHTDSDGSTGRYGNGDVQWMTAGSGMQHCEMFPLVNEDRENHLNLFQIWLNLPKKSKMVTPYYKMLWAEDIPIVEEIDENNKKTKIKLVAGNYKDIKAPNPAPDSWAADEENNVTIWLIELEPNATFSLRPTTSTTSRMIYYYSGNTISIEGTELSKNYAAELVSDEEILITNGSEKSNILLLEGEPIHEPIAAYGPFVMNTEQEIYAAFNDYEKTQFGGWPWSSGDPVNPKDSGRFSKLKNGSTEYPPKN